MRLLIASDVAHLLFFKAKLALPNLARILSWSTLFLSLIIEGVVNLLTDGGTLEGEGGRYSFFTVHFYLYL